MSKIAPFMVGLIASGASYAYVSRELVTSRNAIMSKHLNADSSSLYYPRTGPRRFGRPGNKWGCPGGSGLDSGSSSSSGGDFLPPPPPTPQGEHQLVTEARNKWNAAVLRCSDAIVGALYGSATSARDRSQSTAFAELGAARQRVFSISVGLALFADRKGWEGRANTAGGGSPCRVEGAKAQLQQTYRGHVPPQLGDLGALKYLSLSNNELDGAIPTELWKLGAVNTLLVPGNKLSGVIPAELGQLAALERIDLSGNELIEEGTEAAELSRRSQPLYTAADEKRWREVGSLSELKELKLYASTLTGTIPEELGKVTALEELVLSGNHLSGTIPEELGKLSSLRALFLSSNNLSGEIPKEIGALSKLEGLRLVDNKPTGHIMPELGNLAALRELLLSGNQLSGLPRATAEGFKAMSKAPTIDLEKKPWETPPWRVIQGGWDQVINFYVALSQSGGEVVPRVKLVLIGAVCAGKTTLTRGLLDGHIAEELPSRTRGVDIHIEPWVPDFTPLDVAIWDFAGHNDYYSTHQLFLTDGALHLLVVDLHKFDRDHLSRGDVVYVWLDSLLCRVPESVVLVVGTHVDAFGGDFERSAAALENLKVAITEQLETKRKEWERVWKQIVVPNVWRRVWAVMDALHLGADPDSAVRLKGAPVPIEGRAKHEFVTEEDGLKAWRTADCESAAQIGDSEEDSEQLSVALSKQFKAALELRQRGTLLEEELGAYCDEHGIRFDELVEIHSRFALTGLLTTEYLGFLWRDIVKDMDKGIFGRLVETMAVHDAMLPCGDRVVEGGGGEFMVPARLPGSVAEWSLATPQEAVSGGTRMQFVIEIYAEYVPPAIIARFLGAFGRSGDGHLQNLVIHTCWTRGVSFEADGRECLIRVGENLAPSEGAEASTESRRIVEINVGGSGRADLSELDEHRKGVLQKILDSFGAQKTGIDEALAKQLGSLRSDMQHDASLQLDSHAHTIVVDVDERVREGLSKINSGRDASSATERRALTSVARNVAFLRWPIPRLVCVLPVPESTLQESDREFDQWSVVLKNWCRGGKEKGKGWATRELRVFFLCSHDMSLAECGPGGQGYKMKELLDRAEKAKPSAKLGLAMASITLKEALDSGIEKMASVAGERLGGGSSAGAPRKQNVRPTPLQGFPYDQLKEVVRSFELEGTVKARSPFPSFDTAMQLVDRGGRGEEWAWVRTRNIDQFVSS
eukprot:g6957.t1